MKNSLDNFTQEDLDYILSPKAVREKAHQVYKLVLAGEGKFTIHEEKMGEVVERVLKVIKNNYPDLKIPFHSRWGHFNVGGVDRLGALNTKLNHLTPLEIAKAKLDLVVVSVLLDAGAGKYWKYTEVDGKSYDRSEGLAVASLHMFLAGAFSADAQNPYRVDGSKLEDLTSQDIEKGFQVTGGNQLIGVEGRLSLLKKLGTALKTNSQYFAEARPSNIYDHLLKEKGQKFLVEDILAVVLRGFGTIWPGRISLGETNLGDVWKLPLLGNTETMEGLIPFHKLSQWMTYSLVGPMEEAGSKVTGAENLTGLPEYRNGGLFLDAGPLQLKDLEDFNRAHTPGSELIVEWRALTVALLDRIGKLVREKLGFSEEDFPLAKVLEGGTWWAGRVIAKEKRPDGSSPLKLDSDGTVF